MKVVLQRVKHASCTVENVITGQIEKGYLLLVGFTNGDNVEKLDKAVKKISGLRIFEDENQKMNLNLEKVKFYQFLNLLFMLIRMKEIDHLL